MSKLLLHMCCAPCSEYPLDALREEGFDPDGYFHNPNIQPQKELDRRLEAVENFSELRGLKVFYDSESKEAVWRNFRSSLKEDHCRYCYFTRMAQVARFAKDKGYTAFTSSLFVSPYQDHDLLKQACEHAAKQYGLEFLYRDFRSGYREGQEMAKRDGLYRQKFCGCIYSIGESNYKAKIMKQLDLSEAAIPLRITQASNVRGPSL